METYIKSLKEAQALYRELFEKHCKIDIPEVFFAFSGEQFDQAVSEKMLQGKKILRTTTAGMFGTKEGLDAYVAAVDAINKEIAEKVPADAIYVYEFANHECGFSDDSEAVDMVRCYYPDYKPQAGLRDHLFSTFDY